MATESRTMERQERVASRKLWQAGLAAIISSSVLNLIVYFVATGLLGIELVIPDTPPITAFPVIFSSVAGAIGGTVVLALLGRFTRRPFTIFQIVALVFLIVSFLPLIGPGIALGVRVTLLLMHIVAAAATVGSLVTLARE